MKDPAVLFYTSDFLVGASDLSNEECGKYIKLLCLQHQKGHLSEKQICTFFSLPYEEHMSNICQTYEEHMKKTDETKKQTKILQKYFSSELLSKFKIDEDGKLFNQRFEEEALKRAKYSETRRNNRRKKEEEKKHMSNICQTYEEHMENENVNENENENINSNSLENEKKEISKKIDPYCSEEKSIFIKAYEQVFNQKPYLTNEDCWNLAELVSSTPDFFNTLTENLKKTKKLDFKTIGYKPDAGWFLKSKNYAALRNGVYDGQITEETNNDGFNY